MANITAIRTNTMSCKIITANDILNLEFTGKEGPEIELKDRSIIIFKDSDDYYRFMNDSRIVTGINVNIEYLDKYCKIDEDYSESMYRNTIVRKVIKYIPGGEVVVHRLIR